jgi:uncharacterized protein (DUF1330 family)
MAAYAIGWLRQVRMGQEIVGYLEEIDATLAPFGGKFRIHGGSAEVLEGEWAGDLVAIAFPSMEDARDWYASDAYCAIAALRTRNSNSVVFLVDGVDEAHRATDVLGPPG